MLVARVTLNSLALKRASIAPKRGCSPNETRALPLILALPASSKDAPTTVTPWATRSAPKTSVRISPLPKPF